MSFSKAFQTPSHPEKSKQKAALNAAEISVFSSFYTEKWLELKSRKLEASKRKGRSDHFYDDDILQTISEEFTDRISVIFVIGDIIRALGGILKKRHKHSPQQLMDEILYKIKKDKQISRKDIAEFTAVLPTAGNIIIPFMNGGPAGENWNKTKEGLYDSIAKCEKFIFCVELGFKADQYGLEVSKRLVEKKKANPNIHISLLIDGFVSIFLQKPPTKLDEFQNNTLKMILDLQQAGIDVRINDSWNPLSSDFLSANHIKLWIFDGKVAHFGGIGIESQFVTTLYDQMDLVKGPFVQVLTLVAILLLTNQRRITDSSDKIKQIYEFPDSEIRKIFLPNLTNKGDVTFTLSMNVPGYIQDAQKKYIELLSNNKIEEIYIMAPYFSDDKIARTLIKTANNLRSKLEKEKLGELEKTYNKLSKDKIKSKIRKQLEGDKRIHVIFPKKQENKIIEEVSKYYAYYMRDNPIVETKQFTAKIENREYDMLHAKQMVVVLRDNKGWTKYVKFGGSYNPAGRAHNMWELNAVTYEGSFNTSDEGSISNPIKKYLDDVMKQVISKYAEPFRWGQADVKLTLLERFIMKLAQISWF